MAETKTPALLRAADIATREEQASHPWNPQSQVRGVRLYPIAAAKKPFPPL